MKICLFVYAISVLSLRKKIFRIQEGTSMFMPAVDENGLSHRYDYIGDYVITTYSSGETYTKLGYNGTPSYAGMVSKLPINGDAFRIDVRIKIEKGTKSDGIAFWITDDPVFEKGPVFGRKGVNGMLLAIVTKENVPYIGINLGNNENFSSFGQTVKLNSSIFDEQFTLRVTYDKELIVSLGRNNKYNDVFKVSDYRFVKDSYFAISVKNYTGYSDFRINAIRQSTIEYPAFKEIESERSYGGRWIWIMFAVVVAVIGIVLYRKQITRRSK